MQCVNISDPLTKKRLISRRSVDPSSPSSDSMSTSAFSTISALDMYSNNLRFFIAKDAGVGFSFPFPSTRSTALGLRLGGALNAGAGAARYQ